MPMPSGLYVALHRYTLGDKAGQIRFVRDLPDETPLIFRPSSGSISRVMSDRGL